MEMEKYLIEKARKSGVEDIIVKTVEGNTKQIKFVNNQIVVTKDWHSVSTRIFLSCKRRVIDTVIDQPLSKKIIDNFLKRIIKAISLVGEKKDFFGIAEGPFRYKKISESYDKKMEKINGKVIDFVYDGINAALEEGALRCSGVLYLDIWNTKLFSSRGIEAKDRGTSIEFSIRAFCEKESSGHSVSVSRILKGFNPEKAGREAGELAREYRNPQVGKEGKYDIIFHPLAFANLLDSMTYAFSAFEVDVGTSFLKNKIGKKVANEIVSLKDDGRLRNGLGSTPFDEEGMPTRENRLIDKGVLKTYLHNTSTAKKFKAKPTANAGLIYPSPWNLILEKGDRSLNEMIEETKKGIFITNLWYTRFTNYQTGDFSTLPRDAMFEIRNGKIVRSVKGLRLMGNMQRLLKNIIGISRERRQIKWWEVSTPSLTGYVLCKNLIMSKSVK